MGTSVEYKLQTGHNCILKPFQKRINNKLNYEFKTISISILV